MSAVNTILNALQALIPSFAKSDGSLEAKIIDVVGTYADSESIERKNTVDIINAALASQRVTTREYYRRKSVLFQSGDQLKYDPINQGAYYDPIYPEHQIIKQSFIVGDYPLFTNLVNAIGTDGHLRPLTTDELNAFRTYFQAFQPLGLQMNINSLTVAQISDPGIVIYVQAGTDASDAAARINETLIAQEQILRQSNQVTLSEIEDLIQTYPGVKAVGWDNPTASERQLDGTTRTTRPTKGVFSLTNGAYTFATTITSSMIKVLQ